MIQVRNLSWSYDALSPVLRDVSLSVKVAERVALVGPNGAGKTTLIKCICGLLPFTEGEVLVQGKAVGEHSVRELARLVAYVPQPMGEGLPFSVRDFVMMGRYPYGSMLSSTSAADSAAVDRALEATGMTRLARRIHATLSGGERQKAMLAAALAQETGVMLLDEPSAFLDPAHQAEIDDILLQINHNQRVTIISVTHDLNRAALGNDRIVGLKGGRVVFDAPPAKAMDTDALHALYDVRFTMLPHPGTGQMMVLPRAPQESRR